MVASALDRALDLIELGFSVIPCTPGTKRPALRSWAPYQERHPTRPELEQWFGAAPPDTPIGVVTGMISGIVVIDADSADAEAWAAQHLPETPLRVRTSRGLHFYYRHPEGRIGNRVRVAGRDLDIRGSGGYVIAPGSRHPEGGLYQAEGDWSSGSAWDLPLLPASCLLGEQPERVEQRTRPTQHQADRVRVIGRAQAYASRVDPAIQGQGGSGRTFDLACKLIRGFLLDDEEAFSVLMEWNRTCRPPWSERELKHKIAQAHEKGTDLLGCLLEESHPRQATQERAPRPKVIPMRRPADTRSTAGSLALEAGSAADTSDLPEIIISGRLSEMTDQALAALHAANARRPTFFAQDGQPVRLERKGDSVIPVPLDRASTRGALERVARWVRIREMKDEPPRSVPAHPPKDVAEDLLSLPIEARNLPPLDRIVRAPVFASSGELLERPGYHPTEAIFYEGDGLELEPVPDAPSREQVRTARALILDDLLADFPFVDAASRAHALAVCLLPFARSLISSPTPLHLVDAPTEGTGKTLALQLLTRIFLGREKAGHLSPSAAKDPEWGKEILSCLRLAPSVVLIDNIDGKLDSVELARVLTDGYLQKRELGSTRSLTVQNRCLWVATGNNVQLSREMARRTVLIRLDAQHESPEERTGFRHPDVLGWAAQSRGRLIHACLTIVRAWIVAGRPPWSRAEGGAEIGSFKAWCDVIGGILDVAEVPGFLSNRQDTRARAGESDQEWHQFAEAVVEQVGVSEWFTARDIFGLVERLQLLPSIVDAKSEQGRRSKLGRALSSRLGRVYRGLRIIRSTQDDRDGGMRYKLEEVSPAPSPQPPPGWVPGRIRIPPA